jgi:predicted PurR-regulated permease PerM
VRQGAARVVLADTPMLPMPPPPPRSTDVHFHVPNQTIFKVLATAVVVWAILKLWPEVVFLSISLVLAIALNPFVEWMSRGRLPRSIGIGILAILTLLVLGAIGAFVLPPLGRQAADIAQDLPAFHANLQQRISPENAPLKKVVDELFLLPSSPEVAAELKKPRVWGRSAAYGLTTMILVLVTTLYLLLDGKRLYVWLLAYVPRAHREKMALTVPEVSKVVYAYVRGQFLTSLLFGIVAAIVLKLLGVPAVLPLAIFAAVCDVIPVVGIIVAIAPAVLLGLTVSPFAALGVLGFYGGYHLVETYVIVPRVYGKTLRLSTLTVLLALIVGATLGGILGAVLILPIVAAYPIIERIWLGNYLSQEVIEDHKALEKAHGTGSETAMDAVLQGEKPQTDAHVSQIPTSE